MERHFLRFEGTIPLHPIHNYCHPRPGRQTMVRARGPQAGHKEQAGGGEAEPRGAGQAGQEARGRLEKGRTLQRHQGQEEQRAAIHSSWRSASRARGGEHRWLQWVWYDMEGKMGLLVPMHQIHIIYLPYIHSISYHYIISWAYSHYWERGKNLITIASAKHITISWETPISVNLHGPYILLPFNIMQHMNCIIISLRDYYWPIIFSPIPHFEYWAIQSFHILFHLSTLFIHHRGSIILKGKTPGIFETSQW